MFPAGRLVLFTGLMAAVVPTLLARTGNLASQAPQISGTGSLTGTVIEVGSNAPISDAVVSLSLPAELYWRRTVATDDAGQFVFRNLPKGIYRLRVEADGFVPGSLGQDRPVLIERAQDASLAQTVELADGEAGKGATLRMWRKAGVGGFIGDELGEPVVGVRVSVIARVVDWTGVRMRVSATVATDDRGLYHADVAPGDYIVGVLAATTTASAGWSGGGEIPYRFAPMVGTGGRLGDRLVSTLPGRSDAAPPRSDKDGQVWTCPTTFYPRGSSPAQARVLSLRSGEELPNVDLALVPEATRRVSGRVEFSGEAIGGVALDLILNDAVSAREGAITALEMAQSSSDQAGAFSFVGIPPGDYTLRGVHLDAAGETKGWAVERVSVQNDVTNVLVSLRPIAPLGGTLTILRSSGPALGSTPPSVRISAVPAGGAGALSRPSSAATADLSKPTFFFSVVPGPYVLNVTAPSGWYIKSLTVDGTDALDRPVTIKPGGAKEILVTIADTPASISGVARASDGAPAPFAAVAMFPANRDWTPIPGSQSQRLKVVPASRTGTFRIAGLPPGDYCLFAITGTTPDLLDPNVRATLLAAAPRVTLRDRDTATSDAPVVVIK